MCGKEREREREREREVVCHCVNVHLCFCGCKSCVQQTAHDVDDDDDDDDEGGEIAVSQEVIACMKYLPSAMRHEHLPKHIHLVYVINLVV